jgi:hypothetical protein
MPKIRFTISFCIFLIGVSLGSCAQNKLGIVKAHAYRQLNMPGTIPVGDEHKGPDTVYRVYVETRAGINFNCIGAQIGQISYKILSSKVSPPINIGISEETGEAALVTAKKGNNLWQLNLEKSEPIKLTKNYVGGSKNIVTLKLRYKKKNYTYPISHISVLQPELHM